MEPLGKGEYQKLMRNINQLVRSHKSKYISPIILRKVYRQFRKWRHLVQNELNWLESEPSTANSHVFEYEILKYLLERCFWIRYGDGEVVAYLLSTVYEAKRDLGKLFDYRDFNKPKVPRNSNPTSVAYHINTTWIDAILAKELVKPVDYFMEHANKNKLLFGGKRFAEQYFLMSKVATRLANPNCLYLPSCSLSFQYPELLPKLLKYGLFAKAACSDEDVGKLLTGVIGIFLNHPKKDDANCGEFAIEYTEKVKSMGNCLLRTVAAVDPTILMKSQCRNLKEIMMLVERLSVRAILPTLKTRCGGPQDLQHLCRHLIRRLLYENWMLPHGIKKLPLPELMQDYLNLESD